jgi:hemin uptake protein HemP
MASVLRPRERGDASADRHSVRSCDLFQGENEVVICHRGEEYRLRITRNGKLILTK